PRAGASSCGRAGRRPSGPAAAGPWPRPRPGRLTTCSISLAGLTRSGRRSADVDLTGDDVQDILSLLDGLPFGELRLQTARFSLTLRRTADGEWTQETEIRSEPTVAPVGSVARPAEGPVPDGLRAVRAPLPGTFYRAPMPGAPPLLDTGSPLKPGPVVPILQALNPV